MSAQSNDCTDKNTQDLWNMDFKKNLFGTRNKQFSFLRGFKFATWTCVFISPLKEYPIPPNSFPSLFASYKTIRKERRFNAYFFGTPSPFSHYTTFFHLLHSFIFYKTEYQRMLCLFIISVKSHYLWVYMLILFTFVWISFFDYFDS